MTKPMRTRISPAILALLTLGCSSMFDSQSERLEVDGGHTELLCGAWGEFDHTLDLGTDSAFEECLRINRPSGTRSTGEYCVQGRYTPGTPTPSFEPSACSQRDSLVDCAWMDQALGDSATLAEDLLMTLRHKDRRFDANVIIERECEKWKPSIFGDECVKEGSVATGSLELRLSARGAPPRNDQISLSRWVNPDSL